MIGECLDRGNRTVYTFNTLNIIAIMRVVKQMYGGVSMEAALKNTSFDNGFGIFKKLSELSVDVVNNNYLRLFMLNTENKRFNYDELYEYLLPNIARYVFNRRKIAEIDQNPQRAYTVLCEAVAHLREIAENGDKGAGGELGEILLYLFLEQDLKAPKLFSKVELKTSGQDYIKGSDGIHFKFRTNVDGKKILQLVVGEAKMQNDLDDGIKAAFESINTYIITNTQDRNLLDTHLVNQLVNEQEAIEIKSYILEIPRKKRETIFGIFIGYSIEYKGETDDNDTYDKNVIIENEKQVLAYIDTIINQINKYQISNYQFNFYFLPFHDVQKDRKEIMKQIKEQRPHYNKGGTQHHE